MSICFFGKLGSPGAPEPTLGPTTPLNGPGRAKIGVNAPHVVQLTGLGQKKTNLNRSPPTSVPFTRNQPQLEFILKRKSVSKWIEEEIVKLIVQAWS